MACRSFSIKLDSIPQFYGDGRIPAEKIKAKDYFEVIKENRALQTLLIAASTDKLASSVYGAATVYFYIYAVKMGIYSLP
jgi:Na+/melibiose symporter-like transporter